MTTVSPLPRPEDVVIERLGEPSRPSPLRAGDERFVDDDDRVLVAARTSDLTTAETPAGPSFEAAGARRHIFFQPEGLTCGIVTCGGLCPGLNDVIRSLVLTLNHGYGVHRIVGFRYGYVGLSSTTHREPILLDPEMVESVHLQGGTLLGTSRGARDVSDMVDTLVRWKVGILFAIGGDGTLRGASEIAREIRSRNLKIGVIGIPKTIDNDLLWTERSFGFSTAVEEARRVLDGAHAEARAAWNGVGLVKLMGRHSGFITAYATLSSGDVNFCLVPEVPFDIEGPGGFLQALEDRLASRHHAVVVVAEGAGQEHIERSDEIERDASGNVKLKDIGGFLRDAVEHHFHSRATDVTVKYIDPSYTIRSLPANSMDSAFCLILGQHAVHAGMAGRTNMMVGFWNHCFTHVPLDIVAGRRKQLDPRGEDWTRVLAATGQPASMSSS